MAHRPLPVAEALARWEEFDAVLDARSPAEFALDHLPGALNWPVLSDEERRVVGTDYKQVSAFEARKLGAALVARNIAALLDAHAASMPKGWKPLVYCWRGGQRSGTLAWFLDQIGFRTHTIEGGYKAFREAVLEELKTLPERLRLVVIGGRTGSGKSRLLQTLKAEGAQVLDLEALASHRGSVLGALPGCPQPSQKAFDTAVWHALRGFDPARPVFVESESRKIGQLHVPESLMLRMREHGSMVLVDMPLAARVDLLLQDYAHFADEVEVFCSRLESMVELRGRERVSNWQQMARDGRWAEVFEALVRDHYDPLYTKSMRHNYAGMAQARTLMLDSGEEKALRQAAQGLVGTCG